MGHRMKAAAAALLVCVALPPAEAAETSPALKALAAAADKEGQLTLVWSPVILGGADGMARIEAGMNAMFGTKVSIKYSPGASLTQLAFQIMQEARQKKASTSDILIAPSLFAGRFAAGGLFHTADWQALLPGRIGAGDVEANGALLRFVSVLTGITYNSKLLPNPPRTLAGFLAAGLAGKLATTPYAAGFGTLTTAEFYGPEKGMGFVKGLIGQVSGFMRCGEEHRIASGEFLALVFDCGGGTVELFRRKGAPVAQIIPSDYASIYFLYLTVPKNAAHPNAAKLFSVFMMSEEGQKIAWETWGQDLHSMPGAQTRSVLAKLAKDGIEPKVLDTGWALRHPEAEKARREIVKLIQAKSR